MIVGFLFLLIWSHRHSVTTQCQTTPISAFGGTELEYRDSEISKFKEGADKGDLRRIDALIGFYDHRDPEKVLYWRQRFMEEDSKVCCYDWRSGMTHPPTA